MEDRFWNWPYEDDLKNLHIFGCDLQSCIEATAVALFLTRWYAESDTRFTELKHPINNRPIRWGA